MGTAGLPSISKFKSVPRLHEAYSKEEQLTGRVVVVTPPGRAPGHIRMCVVTRVTTVAPPTCSLFVRRMIH